MNVSIKNVFRACTWAVGCLAVGRVQQGPVTVSAPVSRTGLVTASAASLLTEAPTAEGTRAPGAPRRQTSITGTRSQRAVPQSMFTRASEETQIYYWKLNFEMRREWEMKYQWIFLLPGTAFMHQLLSRQQLGPQCDVLEVRGQVRGRRHTL